MSETIPTYGSRPDLLDTGQWHLAVDISRHGFGAWLMPETITGRPPRVIASASWDPSDEGLLTRIENVVYDNPAVLDDYSADIILECGRQLWLPSRLYPTDEDCAEAYIGVYGGEMYDVMVNDLGKERVAFMLAPGMKSFMQRSFPGARIWSQQALLKEAAARSREANKCLIDVREDSFDMVLVHMGELLCASTHDWNTEADIAYHLFSMLQAFDVPARDTDVVLSGRRETRQSTGKSISAFVKSVSQKNHDLEGLQLPTAIYLAINRKIKNANHPR